MENSTGEFIFSPLEEISDHAEKNGFQENKEEILPLDMDYLTPKMMHELRYILREGENKEADLKAFKQLIEKEKNLHARMDDAFLVQFLRARKYDVRRAFKLFQNYYSFRKEFKHIYDAPDLDANKIREMILHNYLGFLRYRDRNGAVVFVGKAGGWDPSIDTFDDGFITLTCCALYAIEIDATQVTGFRAIFDLRGMSWKQMKYATPSNLYLAVRSLLYCFPGRYKGIHILTESKFFSVIWSTVYPFLTEKIKSRVLFHGKDLSGIQEYIHPSVLPVEYGGQAEPFDNSSWSDILYDEEQEQILLEMRKYGYK